MKKSFITLAVLIAIVPHLGFPQVWKDIFVSIAALLIIVLVAVPRRETASSVEKVKREASFIESSPQPKEKEQISLPHE